MRTSLWLIFLVACVAFGSACATDDGTYLDQVAPNDGATPTPPATGGDAAPDATSADGITGGTPADGVPGDGTPADGTHQHDHGTPADGVPGDGTPADGTTGDGIPGDATPADGVNGDGTPADGVNGDNGNGDNGNGDSIDGPVSDVVMEGFAFDPDEITISVGTTVRWTNNFDANHDVSSGVPGDATGLFELDVPAAGGTATFLFDTPGEFPYFCSIHPSMRGLVTVTE